MSREISSDNILTLNNTPALSNSNQKVPTNSNNNCYEDLAKELVIDANSLLPQSPQASGKPKVSKITVKSQKTKKERHFKPKSK